MKLKLRTMYAGPAGNVAPGHVGEFSEAEGEALLAAGFAEAVADVCKSPTPSEPPAPRDGEAKPRPKRRGP